MAFGYGEPLSSSSRVMRRMVVFFLIDGPGCIANRVEELLIGKYQGRFPGFDDKIIAMYPRGCVSTRDILAYIEEIYGLRRWFRPSPMRFPTRSRRGIPGPRPLRLCRGGSASSSPDSVSPSSEHRTRSRTPTSSKSPGR